MQFSVMPILALAFFGSMVSADCCKNGLNYCGSGLLNKGNYFGEISTALKAAQLPDDANYVQNTLFHCGSCTLTPVEKNCVGLKQSCINGGDGKDDFCS